MALLEICCFNADNAILAWKAGADRIEFCDDRDAGGTTPTLESLLGVKQQVTIPVFVMIRPRGGDFCYSDLEFDRMKADADAFKLRVDGFVFGILDQNQRVDVQRTAELVRRAHPLPCTFHRAFDETRDQFEALEDVITSGCHAILSSGGASNAIAGAGVLAELFDRASGRIIVMPGGGVRSKSISEIQVLTKANIYHSSAIDNGCTEPEASEIRLMKMHLREHGVDSTNTAELLSKQAQSGDVGVVGGNDTFSQPHMPAVSVGTNTPVDEIDKHL